MRFLIIGAGAVGSYIGGSLASAGQAVTFVARPRTADALEANGLRLQRGRSAAPILVGAFTVTDSVRAAFSAGSYDCVVLTVKSYDTINVLSEIRAVTAGPPPILCLQNGVDNESEIAAVFGVGAVIAGAVAAAVTMPGPGLVLIARRRGIGLAAGHPLSESLSTTFAAAKLRPRTYASADSMKWSKLFTNLMGNATSALLDLPVAAVFADPRLFAVEVAALRECLAVMRAKDLRVVPLPGLPARAAARVVANLPSVLSRLIMAKGVATGRGAKMPSLHVDLYAGRPPTEVEALYGAVARHGAAAGVPTPVNQVLKELVLAMSHGEISRDTFQGKPEEFVARVNQSQPVVTAAAATAIATTASAVAFTEQTQSAFLGGAPAPTPDVPVIPPEALAETDDLPLPAEVRDDARARPPLIAVHAPSLVAGGDNEPQAHTADPHLPTADVDRSQIENEDSV